MMIVVVIGIGRVRGKEMRVGEALLRLLCAAEVGFVRRSKNSKLVLLLQIDRLLDIECCRVIR